MLLLGENPRQTLPVSSSTPMTGVNSGKQPTHTPSTTLLSFSHCSETLTQITTATPSPFPLPLVQTLADLHISRCSLSQWIIRF
ncbi:hypothetical protein Hdeb2414_s0002g00044881 [Helianthus debilis subsp. tardiflorus]